MVEVWRPVVGHECEYEVSDQGRVRSLDCQRLYRRLDQYSGKMLLIKRKHRGRMLRPGRMASGHLSVAIGRGNSRLVHHLVLEAFVGPCPAGQEGLHYDDVPSNNCLPNLSWGTRSENLLDAVRNGKKAVGERHHRAKLRDADIPVIRSLFGVISYCDIAKRYGVSDRSIRQIKDGRTWKGVMQCS